MTKFIIWRRRHIFTNVIIINKLLFRFTSKNFKIRFWQNDTCFEANFEQRCVEFSGPMFYNFTRHPLAFGCKNSFGIPNGEHILNLTPLWSLITRFSIVDFDNHGVLKTIRLLNKVFPKNAPFFCQIWRKVVNNLLK